MRIIKLSQSDPDMVTREMVENYFTTELYAREPEGRFLLTKGRIKEDGLYEGEVIVFTYKAQIVYLGVVEKCVQANRGQDSDIYPSFFCIDMDSLVRGKGTLSKLEAELHKNKITSKKFAGQGWVQVIPEENEHLLNNILVNFTCGALSSQSSAQDKTEATAEVKVRVGQSKFRELLKTYWKGCAVTGVQLEPVLVASHIKPWKSANGIERLDVFNGLLLSPNLDAAFDKGYISFDSNGVVMIANEFKEFAVDFGITSSVKLRNIDSRHSEYLSWHRRYVYRR